MNESSSIEEDYEMVEPTLKPGWHTQNGHRFKILTLEERLKYEQDWKKGLLPWYKQPGQEFAPYEYQIFYP